MLVGGSTAVEERPARIRASLEAGAHATSETAATSSGAVAAAAGILTEAFPGKRVATAWFSEAPAA